MARIAPWSPNDDDHSALQVPRRDEPSLAVIEPLIDKNGVAIGENDFGVREIEPALFQRPFALGR